MKEGRLDGAQDLWTYKQVLTRSGFYMQKFDTFLRYLL